MTNRTHIIWGGWYVELIIYISKPHRIHMITMSHRIVMISMSMDVVGDRLMGIGSKGAYIEA